MANKKVTASQNGFIVGKLIWAGVNEHKDADGIVKGWFYSTILRLANGASLKTSKYVKDKEAYPNFISEKMNEYLQYPERIKAKEDIYVMSIIKPAKDTGIQFDKFTCSIENNEYRIAIDAWVSEVLITYDGMIEFKSGKSIAFSSTGADFTVDMIVSEIISDRVIKLTTGTSEYPIEIIAELDEAIDNNAVVGIGYKMELSVKKGKKSTVTSDWSGEAKSKFAPDYVSVDSVLGVVKGLSFELATGKGGTVLAKKSF